MIPLIVLMMNNIKENVDILLAELLTRTEEYTKLSEKNGKVGQHALENYFAGMAAEDRKIYQYVTSLFCDKGSN